MNTRNSQILRLVEQWLAQSEEERTALINRGIIKKHDDPSSEGRYHYVSTDTRIVALFETYQEADRWNPASTRFTAALDNGIVINGISPRCAGHLLSSLNNP